MKEREHSLYQATHRVMIFFGFFEGGWDFWMVRKRDGGDGEGGINFGVDGVFAFFGWKVRM